jgi:hypothetical protein
LSNNFLPQLLPFLSVTDGAVRIDKDRINEEAASTASTFSALTQQRMGYFFMIKETFFVNGKYEQAICAVSIFAWGDKRFG